MKTPADLERENSELRKLLRQFDDVTCAICGGIYGVDCTETKGVICLECEAKQVEAEAFERPASGETPKTCACHMARF